MKAVDCQGFGGGFTLGVVEAGFELAGKRELPGGFGVESCEANRHLLQGAWETQVGPADTWDRVPADLLFGNPPCSGFSIQGGTAWRNLNLPTGAAAPINECMRALVGYAARVKPQVAVFESVQGAYKTGRPLMQALRAMLEERTRQRWTLYHVLHNNAAVGGASLRPRYFWVASRVPFGIEMPERDRLVTVAEAIGDLQSLTLKKEAQRYRRRPTEWSEDLRSETGEVDGHFVKQHRHSARISWIMENLGWEQGQWYVNILRKNFDRVPRDDLFGEQLNRVANGTLIPSYEPVRWVWDKPGRVIDGDGARVVHPLLPRSCTLRELYRLQGFCDDWRLSELSPKAWMYPGKGIPVNTGRWIAGWARDAIDGEPGPYGGERIGDREFLIDATLGLGVSGSRLRPRRTETDDARPAAALAGTPRGEKGRAIASYFHLHPSAAPTEVAESVGCSVGRVYEALQGRG